MRFALTGCQKDEELAWKKYGMLLKPNNKINLEKEIINLELLIVAVSLCIEIVKADRADKLNK